MGLQNLWPCSVQDTRNIFNILGLKIAGDLCGNSLISDPLFLSLHDSILASCLTLYCSRLTTQVGNCYFRLAYFSYEFSTRDPKTYFLGTRTLLVYFQAYGSQSHHYILRQIAFFYFLLLTLVPDRYVIFGTDTDIMVETLLIPVIFIRFIFNL